MPKLMTKDITNGAKITTHFRGVPNNKDISAGLLDTKKDTKAVTTSPNPMLLYTLSIPELTDSAVGKYVVFICLFLLCMNL
jgi:hypothetical protein